MLRTDLYDYNDGYIIVKEKLLLQKQVIMLMIKKLALKNN